MTAETKKVLEMLAEGKISTEEAEQLLSRLSESRPTDNGEEARDQGASGSGPKAPLRYLRIVVDSSDGDKVNIRVPLALVKTGIKLTAMLPQDANRKLSEQGIDLSHLSELEGEELLEALRELQIDVDSSDGDTVRVFCE